jgi:hypothetical protein
VYDSNDGMAKYDIGYITERYNAILKKLAAGTATKSVYRESRELLKYTSRYPKKGLKGKDLRTISMILSDIRNIANAQERKTGKRKSSKLILSAATATMVRPREKTQTAEAPRATLSERARERIGHQRGIPQTGEKKKIYTKVEKISDLTIKYASRSTSRFAEMDVEMANKSISGIEMEKGKVKVEDGRVNVRIGDATGEIKVSLDLKDVTYTKDGNVVRSMTVEELVASIKGRTAEISVKGVLKEDPVWGFTVNPYLSADEASISSMAVN